MRERYTAYAALILAEIVWGSLLVIAKPALNILEPQAFLFLRYLIAFPFIIPMAYITWKRHNFPTQATPQLLIHELLCGLNILLLYYCLQYVSALQASLLITIRPIFITMSGIIFLKETEERHEVIGLILATAGATLIISGPLTDNNTSLFSVGVIGILLTNVIDALLTVNFKKHFSGFPKQSLNLFHVLFALSFYAFVNHVNIPAAIQILSSNSQILYSVAFAGIFGSIMASILSIYGISKIEISEATLFSYLKPIVYIPLAVLWLHESINYTQIIGLLTILTGLMIAEIRQPQHWYTKLFKRSHHHHQDSYHLRH